MKLTINPKEVSPILKKIERVVANKNSIAILDCFLFDVRENGSMIITAFDNEIMVRVHAPMIECDGSFKFCVNAKKFSQTVSTINSDSLVIELDGNATAYCTHKKGKFQIPYYNGDDYPVVRIGELYQTTTIKSPTLFEFITDVNYAIGTDTLMPQFMGIYFDFKDDDVVSVATDTRMLAKSPKKEGVGDHDGMKPFIMPSKAASVLLSFIDPQDENCELVVQNDEKLASFTLDGKWQFLFRQIAGRYPNYDAVFPKESSNKAFVNRANFLESLNRIILFSPSVNTMIRLHFKPLTLELVSQDLDYNMSANEELSIAYQGDEITIGFSGNALMSAIGSMNSEEVVFELTDAQHAAIIYPPMSDVRALIMPMML